MHPLAAKGALLAPLPLLAFLNADGVAWILHARAPPDLLVAPSTRPRAAPPPFHATRADAIFERNPFDSETGPLGAHSVEIDPLVDDLHEAPSCDGVRVVAIASSSDPDWSLTALEANGEGRTLLRRRGGAIGARRVAFVGWDRVWLEGDGGYCQSAMFAPRVDAPKKETKGAPPDPIAGRVRSTAPQRFEVDRGLMEEIVRDPTALLRSTRVMLDAKDGEARGMRLYGVGPGTVLGTLGLANGDRLESINGFDLTRPETALEAYARLRDAAHLTLKIERGGRPMQLDYDVR